MPKGKPPKLPTGIKPKTRTVNGKAVPVVTRDGTPVYRVHIWDAELNRQVERVVEGLDEAKAVLAEFKEGKRRLGRLQAERIKSVDVAARYLVAYKAKRDGTPRPKSSLAKERTCLNVYVIPALGNAWIGDLDLPDLNEAVRGLTLRNGTPASASTKGTVASVIRRLFAWAREERMGHSKIETTKNIYGHLFAQDQTQILKSMNAAVSRLYVQEEDTAGDEAA